MSDTTITFDGELSGIKSKLDELSDYSKGIGDKIAGFGVAAFGAWGAEHIFEGFKEGISKIIELTKEFVAVATHAAQVEAQLDAALTSTGHSAGFTAGELGKMAEDLQRITTYGHDTIKTAETLLLRFTEIKGDQFKQTAALALDMATRMGGDAASAANDLGRALNNPLRGMMLMEREGHTLTQSQQEVIQALVASGQTAAAQNVLLGELQKMYGGASEAAAQAAGGGFAQVHNRLEDLKEDIGKGLIPLLDDLAPAFKFEIDEIEVALKELIGTFTDLGKSVTDSFGTTGPEKLVGAIGVLKQELNELLKTAATVGLAIDTILHPSHAKDNMAGAKLLDQYDKLGAKFSPGLSPTEAAAKAAVNNFREAMKHDQKESEDHAKSREESRAKTPEQQIDPNLLAFSKSFPGLTANLDGLKKFGDDMKAATGNALHDAGAVAGAIAAPLAKTFVGIGDTFAGAFKPMDGFTSKLESATEMFNRIQSAAASTPTQDKALDAAQLTAEKTTTVAEKITSAASTLLEIKALMGKGGVMVLG